MINRAHKLSVVRQAKLLGLSRSSVYYSPRRVPDGDLALMRRIGYSSGSLKTSLAVTPWCLPTAQFTALSRICAPHPATQ
jgi:hypothetical protein